MNKNLKYVIESFMIICTILTIGSIIGNILFFLLIKITTINFLIIIFSIIMIIGTISIIYYSIKKIYKKLKLWKKK